MRVTSVPVLDQHYCANRLHTKAWLCHRENVTNLMCMAQFLKQNGTEDFKVYSDTMCAIYRGVRARSDAVDAGSSMLVFWGLSIQ